ncbi:putative callose synthase 8 isoform X3 [Phalaenopsis equestris]|uniref:putative callose synthase 8 isoform X3 n=1 Tax=Phalaenopsis equestris TaxID=78828 RepID=UPI0009E43D88|nr:putative callose synthase 8 isoform X3 [Phalaenopsis equestris]
MESRLRIVQAMEEIVPEGSSQPSQWRLRAARHSPEPFDSEKLPPILVSEIRRFLRVANELERESPRAAYLCRFHAFEKIHTMDQNSSGRGVRQLKTSLLQRLERDEEVTKLLRLQKSDARELEYLYLKKKSENALEIAFVLMEVLKAVSFTDGHEFLPAGGDIKEKSESYSPYNILPFDSGDSQNAIMLLPEIEASISAIRNVRGLPSIENSCETGLPLDLLYWLQNLFGFQTGSVSNQREHLVLLLANMHVRQNPKPALATKLDDRAVDELMGKLFRNYRNWCKFLGRKCNFWLPSVKQEIQQHKILYIALYLLIWGEASNLRLMPECLCYIFHHMAYELYGVLSSAVSLNTGKKVVPAYGGQNESFLRNVVTPIYKVIYEEAQKNKNGVSDHSKWRNYDDLNEFFWSTNCFKLGWPLRLENDFFCTSFSSKQISTSKESPNETCEWKWLGKTNFVEVRSFWHLFRSFDRLWTFLLLALQMMTIMAWHELETPLELFDPEVFDGIMSIFVTNAILRFLQVVIDISLMWGARQNMEFSQRLRYLIKFLVALIWAITLPVSYATSQGSSVCSTMQFQSDAGNFCISLYLIFVLIYLISNFIGVALFFVPAVTHYIETSSWLACSIISWWTQSHLYVGRGMQEAQVSLLKYTIFWVILLSCKLLFSYHFQIKPLIEPTKHIMKVSINTYDWHEFFPEVQNNAGAILAVWAPILLVYVMDTQIWYSIFCAIFGGVCGIVRHLGEIRTAGMVRSRFYSFPSMFNGSFVAHPSQKKKGSIFKDILKNKVCKSTEAERDELPKFAHVWNQIIANFRSEDLISNREMDMMIMPLSSKFGGTSARWPLFLLAMKFSSAVNMARDYVGKHEKLSRKIKKDKYMFYAIKECYDTLKNVFNFLVVGDLDKRVLRALFDDIETSIRNSSTPIDFKLAELPVLIEKVIKMVEILVTVFENNQTRLDALIISFQGFLEFIINDMMVEGGRILDIIDSSYGQERGGDVSLMQHVSHMFKSDSRGFIVPFSQSDEGTRNSVLRFPLPDKGPLKDQQIKRLFLMLTVKEAALDIPANLEVRRRISFFATSLFMDMPPAPKVRNMLSLSIMTPYFLEEVKFSEDELRLSQDGGASILYYMQKIYPDEWKNLLERFNYNITDDDTRCWASFRGQTLSRTVRGMMYYRKALKLQAFLDICSNQDIAKGCIAIERDKNQKNSQNSLAAKLDALIDMKFTYIISCQMFGLQKAAGDSHAQDIIDLMSRYPSLRVAYIEEKEEIVDGKPHKVYSSVLIKAVNNLDQEVYRIKLPGPPIIGEGKPENQNHAIIFTRGEALQAIDMNQDNNFEEAYKMRNLLQEFIRHSGQPHPTILGLREHIFTGSISSLAGFMSYQETSFVTIGQRFLANPLRVRFHYGHPDLFDRIFHITQGGISKASKTINLSEGVFSGFNSILRQGHVTYHEYMQVGKGRDVGLNQISKFEAKLANGNGEQTLSRDIYRLGHRFDFFRLLSFYFTTVGYYFNNLISVFVVYVFLYGRLYLVLSGVERALIIDARLQHIKSLETVLATQSFLQLGLLTGLPMVMELGLEKGFLSAMSNFILMQLQLAASFFTFSLGTKAHHFGRTILHGGAKYRPTGCKFVVFHAGFTENYQLYSRSHFVKGIELIFLLSVYNLFSMSYESSIAHMMITYSTWFMAINWLFVPFLFNPSGFAWRMIVEDWADWNKWMNNVGGIGVQPEKCWESWWNTENAHLRHSGLCSRIIEILLCLRFFIYQYGLVYHLDISQKNKNIVVYMLSWFVILAVFLLVKIVGEGSRRLSTNYHLIYRFLKLLIFLSVLAGIFTMLCVCRLSVMDLVICCLAFLPTGWGLLSVAQTLRPKIEEYGVWEPVKVVAQAYDYGMGGLLFIPIAVLAWMPLISTIQTRVLFNQAFTRQLQIHPILYGKNRNR